MATDITDRKRAESALRGSEEKLQIAILSGKRYAFEWDIETDAVQRSGAYATILGIYEDDLKHCKAELIEQIHPEEKDQYLGTIRSLSPEKPSYKVVFRLKSRDQRITWLEESGHVRPQLYPSEFVV